MTVQAIDARLFRDALGSFATGVAVVAAPSPDGGVGMTINSFTSVSLDPPLILWCLGADGARSAALRDAAGFGVSVLAADQEAVARRFVADAAIAPDDPAVEWGVGGAPLVRGALARLACETEARVPGGDHVIMVGRVLAVHASPGPGLTYFRGAYGRTG